jgi:hypothetical protein
MWLFRVVSSAIFLLSIILSIPIAFDVGGRECGLAYSLSLFCFYFFYSCLKLATPNNSRIRWALVNLVGLTQWILVPGLLIWSMNRFSVDANNSSDLVSRTFGGKRAPDISIKEWIFGSGGLAETLTVGSWDRILTYSTPLFQLAEGFCSLLVIQAAGQITRWLVNRPRSDTWMVRSGKSAKVKIANYQVRSLFWFYQRQSSPALFTSYGGSQIFQRLEILMRRS